MIQQDTDPLTVFALELGKILSSKWFAVLHCSLFIVNEKSKKSKNEI